MKIIVIGAGLAGAATAHALAVRGCQVTVLEASRPSVGGSSTLPPSLGFNAQSAPSAGLPVALMAPHQPQHKVQQPPPDKPDNAAPSSFSPLSPLTQLSRLGVAATLQAARSLLVGGQDWQACGALQRAGKLGPQAHWLGDAAWVKPAALVAAWLAHPGITLRTGISVHSLRYAPDNSTAQTLDQTQNITVDDLSNSKNTAWQALTADGRVAGQAQAVVLANAYHAQALLARLEVSQVDSVKRMNGLSDPNFEALGTALHSVAGQVIYGPWTADWQALWPTLLPELAQHSPAHCYPANACAINGNGHFIPAIPWQGGHIWLSGSTYEHDIPRKYPLVSHANPQDLTIVPADVTAQVTAQGITANLQRLQQLIPAADPLLAAQHHAGQVQGWAGTRCTTRDRLPVVGAVSASPAPGLYICSAMGSRGLSFAALCGQHVAALVTDSKSPLPEHVHRAIDAARFC